MGCASSRDQPIGGQDHTSNGTSQPSRRNNGDLQQVHVGEKATAQDTAQDNREGSQAWDDGMIDQQQDIRNTGAQDDCLQRGVDDASASHRRAAQEAVVGRPDWIAAPLDVESTDATTHLVSSTSAQHNQHALDAEREHAPPINASRGSSRQSSPETPAASSKVVDAQPDDEVDTEERAWARLEEKILAEVSCDLGSQDAAFCAADMTELERILVFEDEGEDLKFLDQGDKGCSPMHHGLHQRPPGAKQVRNGQWAVGDFAQPGALMAGGVDAFSSSYMDVSPEGESSNGHVFIMGEDCDIDIDDVDDSDTFKHSQLQKDITARANSLDASSL